MTVLLEGPPKCCTRGSVGATEEAGRLDGPQPCHSSMVTAIPAPDSLACLSNGEETFSWA